MVVWLGNVSGKASTALVGQEAAAPLALRLAAAVDGPVCPWPTDGDASPVSTDATRPAPVKPRLRDASASGALSIVWPQDEATIVIDPDLSPDRQRVAFQAAGRSTAQGGSAAEAGEVWWFVDDCLVGRCAVGQKLFWTPTPGSHGLRAVDAYGRGAVVRFHVQAGAVQ